MKQVVTWAGICVIGTLICWLEIYILDMLPEPVSLSISAVFGFGWYPLNMWLIKRKYNKKEES